MAWGNVHLQSQKNINRASWFRYYALFRLLLCSHWILSMTFNETLELDFIQHGNVPVLVQHILTCTRDDCSATFKIIIS